MPPSLRPATTRHECAHAQRNPGPFAKQMGAFDQRSCRRFR